LPSSIDFQKFCISADDWGISPGVNRGILELCEAGVIRRVSLMATEPFLKNDLDSLLKLQNISLGLHFNLTFGSKFSSPLMLLKTWLFSRGVDKKNLILWVRDELSRQVKILQSAGVPLRHFDGHHHIQIVPGLFDSIADILERENIFHTRIPYDRGLWLTGKAPLNFFAHQLTRSAAIKNFQTLPFRYPSPKVFKSSESLANYLMKSNGAEVLTHPAAEDDFAQYGIKDPVSYSRVEEYRALKSLLV
jgi:predicted glycoside hydrolase/deacetylase ChbG (UPF0249 family)